MSYMKQIKERINRFDSGKAFIVEDFYDIAGYETVRSSLNRLTNRGDIKRIVDGVYYKAEYIDVIGEYEAPSINSVAKALARKYNWAIAPSGNAALNLLGLSTQVPAKWEYVSDGRYACYNICGNKLEFKRRNNGELSNKSELVMLIIQAIKAIGKGKITENDIKLLRKQISEEDKELLLKEGKTASVWVYKTIREICEV